MINLRCGRSSRERADWRGRRRLRDLTDVCLDALDDPHEQQRLLGGLQAHGVVKLTLPTSKRLKQLTAACYQKSAAFFGREMREKAPHAISEECQQGCAIYEDGTEFFEVAEHFDNRFWNWPSVPYGLRGAMLDTYDCMRAVAMRALEALLHALNMDVGLVLSTLDLAQTPPPAANEMRRREFFAGASHTALRVWSYAAGAQPTAWHCDNTLVTLGVRGSATGLRARLLDGRHIFPEESLGDEQIILYAGDSLSYLSGGRVLPLMHEVQPPPVGVTHRLSMPFFLRARRAAVLQPALASPGVAAARGLPSLSVCDLEEDEGGVRQRWSWKRARYFAELHTEACR